MSLQQCHECKNNVSSEAKTCPNCGAPVKKPTSPIVKGFGILILIFIFLAFVGFLFSPGTKTPVSAPSVNNYPVSATDEHIYRELEVCMNYAKKYMNDDKLEFQRLSGECILGLKKYDKKQAAKAFNLYFQ